MNNYKMNERQTQFTNLLCLEHPFRILIADDNPINSLLTKTIVEQILPNVSILEADNGKIAVKIFQTEKPDLIFMDLEMPELDGFGATSEIRKIHTKNRTPIIVLTASSIKGNKEKCLKSGMDDFAYKPITKDLIEKLIHKWLVLPHE